MTSLCLYDTYFLDRGVGHKSEASQVEHIIKTVNRGIPSPFRLCVLVMKDAPQI